MLQGSNTASYKTFGLQLIEIFLKKLQLQKILQDKGSW